MNHFDAFQQFALTQLQQNNVTGGDFRTQETTEVTLQVIPQIIPQLTSSVNTWSSETTTTITYSTRGRG